MEVIPLRQSCLLVTDVQRGFTSLCPAELPIPGGLEIVLAVNRLLELPWARIDATQDWHPPDHCSFLGQRDNLYPPHCVIGTPGADFLPGLRTERFQTIWRKGFQRDVEAYAVTAQHPTLPDFFRAGGITTVVVCGLALNICCFYSARDLRLAGFDVALVEDASAGIDIHAADLFVHNARSLGQKLGIHYITTADVIKATRAGLCGRGRKWLLASRNGEINMPKEISNVSWFERIGQSLKGVLSGGALFLIAFPVLWFNEGCSAHTEVAINELEAQVVTVPNAGTIEPANEEKPICVSGEAKPQGKVADTEFGMPETDALRVVRTVEMYQWKQSTTEKTEKELGGGEKTTVEYHYKKEWSADKPQTSFHDQRASTGDLLVNPSAKRFESRDDIWAPKVMLGAYELPRELMQKNLKAEEKLTPTAAWVDRVPSEVRKSLTLGKDGLLYCSNDVDQTVNPDKPIVGDLRISFHIIKPQPVTVMAVQKNGSFSPFVASNKTLLEYLRPGTQTAAEMVARAEQENTTTTWIVRGVGCFLMALGLYLVFKPLVTFADVIPFLGTLLGTGIALFAAVVALALSLITIALAWLWYRPLLGAALLLAGLLLIGLLFFLGKRMRAARPAVPVGTAKK